MNLAGLAKFDAQYGLESRERHFTYSEIVRITKKFEKIHGKGGFGTVYYGHIDNAKQVAVKILSQSSAQGSQQLHAEALNYLNSIVIYIYIYI